MAKEKKIGAGISLDGEKEFRQAVNAINSDLNVLKSEMELVTSEFADNKNSIEALTAKQKLFEKQIESQKDKISEYEKMLKQTKSALEENKNVLPQYEQKLKDAKATLEQTTAEYGKNSKEVKAAQSALKEAEKDYKNLTTQISKQEKSITDYTVSVNKAKTDINKMNRELAEIEKQASGIDKVNDELEELAEETDDAENAVEDLNKDLKETKESGSGIGSIFSSIGKVGGAAIGGAVTAASGLVTGFLALAESGNELDTQMGKLCVAYEQVGMSEGRAYETLTELHGVLGDTDKATEATMLLAKMSKNEDDLAVNTRILTGAFALYGESIPTEGLAEGMQATAKMGEVQGVLADALEWQGINLEKYNEKLATLSSEEERAAYIQESLTKLYGESADEYRSVNKEVIAANKAQLEYEQGIAAIGKAAVPAMTSLKSFAGSLINDIYPNVEQFGLGLQGLLEGQEGASENISSSVTDIINSLLAELDAILPVVTTVIAEVAPALLTSLTSGLTDNLDLLLSSAMMIIIELSQSLLNMLPEIIKTGMEVITSLMFGIAEATPEIVPTIIEVITEIVSVLTDPENLSELLTAAMTIISELGFALMDSIPQLIDAAMKVITNLCSFILDPANLATILTTALELILALGSGIISAIPELLVSVFELIAGIFKTFTDTDWGDIGTNIVDGLLNGLKKSWENLKKWFSNAFESLKQGVEDIFDINSPSRWASDDVVGNIMNGFVVGFDRDAPKVKQKFDSFMMTFTDDVEYDLRISDINAQIASADIPASVLTVTHTQPAPSNDDKFDRMLALLEIIAINSKKDILLDKKTLVAELAPEMNEELGEIFAMQERGS